MAVINGIIDCIPALLEAIGRLIPLIVIALVDEFPMLIQVGFDALEAIIGGFVDAIPSLLANLIAGVVLLIKAIGTTFIEYDWLGLGKNIIQGIIDGIGSMGGAIAQVASDMANTVMNTLKGAFGIHSPSTVMRDVIGKNMMLGWQEGIDENAPDLQGVVDDMMVEPSLSLSTDGIGGIGMSLAGSLNGLQVVAPIYIGNTLLDTFVTDAITRQEYISGGR
jgi:phage-related minor tail protein